MLWLILIVSVIAAAVLPAGWGPLHTTNLKTFLKDGLIEIVVILIGITCVGFINYIEGSSYDEVLDSNSYELLPISYDIQDSSTAYYVRVPVEDNHLGLICFKYDDGGVVEKSVVVNSKDIHYDNTCTPHIVKNIIHTKNSVDNIWLVILTFGYGWANDINEVYEVYVPTNSISVNFE